MISNSKWERLFLVALAIGFVVLLAYIGIKVLHFIGDVNAFD